MCRSVAISIHIKSLLCAKGGGLPSGKTEGLIAVPVQGKGDHEVVEGLSNPIISFGSTTKSAQATDRSCAAGLRLVVDRGVSQTLNDDCTTSAIESK